MKIDHKNKVVFPLIIILLLIFLPAAIYGTYQHIQKSKEENPNHLRFYNKSIYYYDNDVLKFKYACTTDMCTNAYAKVDEEYTEYTSNSDELEFTYNNIAYIIDGEDYLVYDINSSELLNTFKLIKNYSKSLDRAIVIDKDGLYRVLSVSEGKILTETGYKFLGFSSSIDFSTIYAISSDDKVSIISDDGKVKYTTSGNISSYNSNVVAIKNTNNTYSLYNYSNLTLLRLANKITVLENVVVVLQNNVVSIYKADFSSKLEEFGSNQDPATYNIVDTNLEVIIHESPEYIDLTKYN